MEKLKQEEAVKYFGNFEVSPAFAYLWDRCVYELLYEPKKYVAELCDLLQKYKIDQTSKILDTSAGSGFPALDMGRDGYRNIMCTDASLDEVALFNQKAEEQKLSMRSQQILWLDLPKQFAPGEFDALICRGSIWYASGGWNRDHSPTREDTLDAVKKTLSIFYGLLRKGGVLYVDKFKDSETDHADKVGEFEVGNKRKEVIFWTMKNSENKIRRARMIVRDVETGVEEGVPNVTYDLKEEELETILKEVGFSVTRPQMKEEKFYVPWLAVKT